MRWGQKIRDEWSQEFVHLREEFPAHRSAAWSRRDQEVGGCRTHRNTSLRGKASEGAADQTCPHHYPETPPLQVPFSLTVRGCQLQPCCAGAETLSPARSRYAVANPSRERGMQVMNPSVCTSGEQTANSACAAGQPSRARTKCKSFRRQLALSPSFLLPQRLLSPNPHSST